MYRQSVQITCFTPGMVVSNAVLGRIGLLMLHTGSNLGENKLPLPPSLETSFAELRIELSSPTSPSPLPQL